VTLAPDRSRPTTTDTLRDFPQAVTALALVPTFLLHQAELTNATIKYLHESNVRLTITIGC